MARPGFDVSQYLVPFHGDPLGGQKMQLDAQLQGAQNITQAARTLQTGLQQRRQDEMLRQQLGLRAQQLDSLDRARQDAALRGHLRLGMDREKFQLDQRKYQGGTDAEAVTALMGQLRRGDTNGLAAAAAAATAKDPSLTVRLPGERTTNEVGTSTPEGMSFTLDEAYPEDLNKLRVMRGDKRLLEMDRAAALQNERGMYGAATAGLSRSPFAAMYAPSVEGGIEGAGRGKTGEEMAADAIKMATGERDALLRREGHEAMLGMRESQQRATAENREMQQNLQVHRAIENVVASYKPQVKALNDDSAVLQNMLSEMNSGSAWQQNEAFATSILRMSGKATTEPEMKRLQSRGGQWSRLQMLANGWLKSGEVPESMLKEFRDSTEALLRANEVRRHQLGEEAKNRIYSSSELPFSDPERMVRAGAQAWVGLGLEPLTPEEIAKEAARVRRARGAAGGPARTGGTPLPAVPADGSFPMPDASGEFVPSDPTVRDDPRLRGDGGVGARQRGNSPPGHLGNQGVRPSQVPLVPDARPAPEEDEDAALIRELEAF